MRSARIACLVASILSCACLFANDAEVGVDPHTEREYASPFLRDATRSWGEGNIHQAWRAFTHFIERADQDGDFTELLRCRSDPNCVELDTVGIAAGARLPATVLGSFCDRAARRADRSNCLELMDFYSRRLSANSGREAQGQRVPLTHLPVAYAPFGERPVVSVAVNDKPYKALVDTGATKTAIRFDGDGIVAIPEWTLGIWTLHHGVIDASFVEVASFRLGGARLSPAVLVRRDKPRRARMYPVTVGMDYLLRHGTVCFDWQGRTLHLGELGPCFGGAVAREATLTAGASAIELTVRTPSGETVSGPVDTGAGQTFCSEELASVGPGWEFPFGDHPALRTGCRHDRAITETLPLLIGMETLRAHRAFGWELNPLRVLFVPRGDAG